MLDAMRLRAFPFPESCAGSSPRTRPVFVVEQNRDGQMRTLLVNEFGIDPARLVAVLHYDGTPITARFRASSPARASRLGRNGRRCEGQAPHDLSLAKPKLHHPTLPKNKLGYTRRDYEGASRRCAPAAATIRFPRRSSRPAGSSTSSRTASPSCRHRLLVKTPDYFLGASHGFNTVHGRMPSVLTGRQPRQPRPALPRRLRRRRFGLDRHRPVRARDAARREHGLHRREQRRLRPDQGPVLGHRRPGLKSKKGVVNTRQPIDLGRHGAALGATYVARSFSATRRSWCR